MKVYDAIVIGSGYGGAVIAARLAPRHRVLVIERGRWWRPGTFPVGVLGLGQVYMSRRNPGGLWAMRLGDGTGNAFASAFGGSSVVNYGITARPDAHALAGWPVSADRLAPYFARALEVLRPSANPIGDELGDKQFLDLLEPGRRVDLDNTIDWEKCTQCGRCVPGCNVGAKRSLDRSYLAMALQAGAEVRLETEVQTIEPLAQGGWGVAVAPAGRAAPVDHLRARQVVLAAGTLGTLDILHRSRARVPVGPRFGQSMSMNGDGLAFLYDTGARLSSHSGAPISTSVRLPFAAPDGSTRTLMVMSGRVPMAAMRFTAAALAAAGAIAGPRARVDPRAWLRRLREGTRAGEDSALSRSFMYKLDGQDGSRGSARFTPAGAVIDWPDYADDPVMQFADRRLREWAARVGGTVIPNVARLPGMRSFSVHPLGGCRMAARVDDGVVDDAGRVFDPRGGVHPGLRIADGSIVPASLGVPPSLTIAALAERIADTMLAAA